MPARFLFPTRTNDPSRQRTPWERSRRTAPTFRGQIESEPSWVAMSLATNSSLANAGSGDYARGGETRQTRGVDDRPMSGPSLRRSQRKAVYRRSSLSPIGRACLQFSPRRPAGDGVDMAAVRSATTAGNTQSKATVQSREPICKHLTRQARCAAPRYRLVPQLPCQSTTKFRRNRSGDPLSTSS